MFDFVIVFVFCCCCFFFFFVVVVCCLFLFFPSCPFNSFYTNNPIFPFPQVFKIWTLTCRPRPKYFAQLAGFAEASESDCSPSLTLNEAGELFITHLSLVKQYCKIMKSSPRAYQESF